MTDPPRPTPPGYWLPDDIWQLINERLNNEEKHVSALTEAMQEYANAIRGDWNDFDGRAERDVIESWIAEIESPTQTTLEQWRDRLGLCADGNSHWHGITWGNCAMDTCPTAANQYKEMQKRKKEHN